MKPTSRNPLNYQEGGTHYSQLKVQPIEFIQKHRLSYIVGNIVKYLTRYPYKGGVEDLKKAVQYIRFLEYYVEWRGG